MAQLKSSTQTKLDSKEPSLGFTPEPANVNIQQHIASTGNPHSATAASIPNTPAGNIGAINVQAALNELDTKKQPIGSKGVANGYPSLNQSIEVVQLPAGASAAPLGSVLHQNGTWAIPSSNVVKQVITTQTRQQVVYNPVAAGLTGTQIAPLNIVITPTAAGNSIILEWHVAGEALHDSVFIVRRNGGNLAGTGNVNVWEGIATPAYDNNNASTPSTTVVRIVDYSCLSIASTYSIHIVSSNTIGATWLHLNKVVNSAGTTSHEALLSSGTATEVTP